MPGSELLAQQFHDRLIGLSRIVGKESTRRGKPYCANYYLREVRNHGGVESARRLLARPDPQDGFGRLGETGLFQYSLDAIVLEPRSRQLFTAQELATARRRLAGGGHPGRRPP